MKHAKSLAATWACAAAGALVLAGATAAAPGAPLIPVRMGDQISVAGTSIVCQAQVSKTDFKGKKLIACVKIADNELLAGSYSPALAATGEITVARLTKGGKTIVLRRSASLGTQSRAIRAKVGDNLRIVGTDMACSVSKAPNAVPYISCFHVTGSGGKVGSYSFSIGDRAVAVTQFTSQKASKLVKTFAQP